MLRLLSPLLVTVSLAALVPETAFGQDKGKPSDPSPAKEKATEPKEGAEGAEDRGLFDHKIKLPSFNPPSIKLPEVKIPKPIVPEIKVPKIKVPEIKVPKIKVPEIKVPEIKVPKIGDPSVELWGEGGRRAYSNAANIMQQRNANRSPRQISAADKAVLRPIFGSLVNKVVVYYGADPMNEWKAGPHRIKLAGVEASAQTYGHNIYIRSAREDLSDKRRLSILIHELTHAQQYDRFKGSLSNFGYEYFKAYKKANLNYANNKLEKEAKAQETDQAGPACASFQANK
jgi:hypothetical protein